MKKPKGTMQFIMMKMNSKPKKIHGNMDHGSGASDLLELLSRMGMPVPMPMGHGPMSMKEDDMEDEMEDEMEEDMREEDNNEELDTVELIQKLIKKLEEFSARMEMKEGLSGK